MYRILLYIISLLLIFLVESCDSSDHLFRLHKSNFTGISFNNKITENDSVNPIDLEFLYNGGGVASGDFNNDGFTDLYFTGSVVSNKLYLNKGNFKFIDVTVEAGVTGEGRWANGVSTIDINNDGWLDIYVCNSIYKNPQQRENLLYINKGLNKNGVPQFSEMSSEYNLADTGYSVHAGFFDYDNDGDLDVYLLTTKLTQRDAIQFSNQNTKSGSSDIDRLYRNDWDSVLQHPVFRDVSLESGIVHNGYGLGLAIADINRDGWKDIYVTNDFYGSDLLYINNKNGTFTNKISGYLKHTSQNAMGNDIADINNDGLADIFTVDMNPEDNFRKKKNLGSNNYSVYQNMLYEGYTLQYVRNTLQLNMGHSRFESDSIGDPVFAEIGFYSGVAETDWSWNPSLADFDNDGYRDIIVTNGYPRDVTDHDFGSFRTKNFGVVSKQELIDQMPQIKIPNYSFRNTGNLKFENSTEKWGFNKSSFSNGAVYADLDNDGDLDYVVNNINDEAFVYENKLRDKPSDNNYIKFKFKGSASNKDGIGTFITIHYGNQLQVYENSPFKGYLSSVDAIAFFGLGSTQKIDSAKIVWPDGRREVILNIPVNQFVTVDYKNSENSDISIIDFTTPTFTEITSSAGVNYSHQEMDYIDFNDQRLLPHKLSQYGPGLASGDIDGNGLDDFVVGGTGDFPGHILFQQSNGIFILKKFPSYPGKDIRTPENMGLLLFDADNDSDLDLYVANGSNEFAVNTKNYQDRIAINDGSGNFTWDTLAIPLNFSSKSSVKACDFDKDGDLDLFIGSRVIPGSYPKPASSIILRNDSKPGSVRFTDITKTIARDLINLGLVCDAIWSDFDNDGWTDLIIAGEWMPITFLKNIQGRFINVTTETGISSAIGWWNSITAGDFDNDGDIDYVAGNLGSNSFYRGSQKEPVSIYANDFDLNKGYDIIPTVFLPDGKGSKKEFTAHNRDDFFEQLPGLKKRFLTYKEFGLADFPSLVADLNMNNAFILKANYFESSYLENIGGGKFKITALPALAQLAPVYGMVAEDVNEDGNLDLLLVGNDFGTEVSTGRYDALNGLVLEGNGLGGFYTHTAFNAGFYVPGDAKALIKLSGAGNSILIAASQNRGSLKLFRNNNFREQISLRQTDAFLSITMKSGKKRKEEIYFGSSFLSQSSNRFFKSKEVSEIEITDINGKKRNK